MIDQPAFLDVNIPMYAAGRDHPYKESCAWLLTEIAYGRLETFIDAEIIQEILYRFGALQRWQIGMQMAQNVLDLVPNVMPVTADDMQLAVSLFGTYAPQGVKARDLLHAAIMKNHGLTHIISTDNHFDQIEGIIRLDPKVLFAKHK